MVSYFGWLAKSHNFLTATTTNIQMLWKRNTISTHTACAKNTNHKVSFWKVVCCSTQNERALVFFYFFFSCLNRKCRLHYRVSCFCIFILCIWLSYLDCLAIIMVMVCDCVRYDIINTLKSYGTQFILYFE